MQNPATHYEARNPAASSQNSGEVLEAVGALRDYMRSMDAQVQELMAERERLAAELEQMRGRSRPPGRCSEPARPSAWGSAPPQPSDWRNEAHRVTDELDQLVRLYETASRRRNRGQRSSRAPADDAAAAPDQGAWLKKMVMFLMMAELV